MDSLNRKSKKAFSLAEVLITLAVVGIVASMSIPSLIANKNKNEYATGLKKAYASSLLALQKMAQEMGCMDDLACTGVFASHQLAGDAMSARMNVTQNCGTTDLNEKSDKGCWATVYWLDGSSTGEDQDNSSESYGFMTADGMSFSLNTLNDADCGGGFCSQLFVDINGKKGPNRNGRDVFTFYIMNPVKVVARGTQASGQSWKTQGCGIGTFSNWGYTCAGRVMEEGWQMTY